MLTWEKEQILGAQAIMEKLVVSAGAGEPGWSGPSLAVTAEA